MLGRSGARAWLWRDRTRREGDGDGAVGDWDFVWAMTMRDGSLTQDDWEE